MEQEIERLKKELETSSRERNNHYEGMSHKEKEEYQFATSFKSHYHSGDGVGNDTTHVIFKGKTWARDLILEHDLYKLMSGDVQKLIQDYLDKHFMDGMLYLSFVDSDFIARDDPTTKNIDEYSEYYACFIMLEIICLKRLNIETRSTSSHKVLKISKSRIKKCPGVYLYDVIERCYVFRSRSRSSMSIAEHRAREYFWSCFRDKIHLKHYYAGKATLLDYYFYPPFASNVYTCCRDLNNMLRFLDSVAKDYLKHDFRNKIDYDKAFYRNVNEALIFTFLLARY